MQCAVYTSSHTFLCKKKVSRTLHTEVDLVTFDKEHFSTEPKFTDFTVELENDSDDDSVKQDMYVVNR